MTRSISPAQLYLVCRTLCAFVLSFLLLAGSASAQVVRQDDSSLARELKVPISIWKDDSVEPRAIVVALHGLVMHAGTFDVLARNLVSQGFLVVAPDLRGYGRWLQGGKELPPDETINYVRSQDDISNLLSKLNSSYPNLPLYCVGESLGADEAIHVAAAHPEWVAGLVLSSPALKRRNCINGRVLADLTHICTSPHKQLDMTPYIKVCASEDPRVIQGMLDDPLVRKHLSSVELVRSNSFMRATCKRIKQVPASIPVLVMQGDADRLLKSNSVVMLIKRLQCRDQTVHWFHERGHVLLETAYVKPDTMQTVQGWLVQHAKTSGVVKTAKADSLPSAPAR